MINLSELVRMPRGTVQTYLLEPHETESYLLKRLSTYALRARAKIEHRVALVVFLDDDSARRMVICKVIQQGRKLKKRGRKRGKKS